MKKLYNINKSVSRRFSATVLTLVASFLCATSVWGEMWLYDNGTFDIELNIDGTTSWQFGDNIARDNTNTAWKDFSSEGHSTIKITKFWTKANANENWGYRYCGFKARVSTNHTGNFDEWWSVDAGSEQKGTYTFNVTNDFGNYFGKTTPGKYYFDYYFGIGGGDDNKYYRTAPQRSGDTGDPTSYYSLRFCVPGFANAETSATITAEPSGNASKTITFNHYGTALTTSRCALSGTDAAKFSFTSINESGVTVQFNAPSTEGTYTATLTITDAHSKTAVITLTGVSGYPTTVEIAGTPVVENGPKVTLSGYLRYSGCLNDIMDYGFVYKPNAISGDPTLGSDSTVNSNSQVTLKAKETFSKSFIQSDRGKRLAPETTYKYRVYAKSTSGGVFYSSVGTFTTLKECQIAVNDTVYYTIDNTQPEDPCELRFQTLANAITDAKKTHKNTSNMDIAAWINASGFVQAPLVFEVVYGTYGDADNTDRTDLSNINGYAANDTPTLTTPTNRLIIRAQDATKKPIIKGGLDMTRSRYITLKNLEITRSTNTTGHDGSAIELGYYYAPDKYDPNQLEPGKFTNTNVEIIGCKVEAEGFNCIHARGCEGIKFEECEFDLGGGSGDETNDKNWGASVKLMSCKKVQFTRNSLKGSHCTTLWLQSVQEALVMNNVFWNSNLFDSNVAFVRPIVVNAGSHKVSDLAIFYNTFYLADHASSAYNIDFLRFGGPATGQNIDNFDTDKIHFKYNNCYSYDDKISARNNIATAFLGHDLTDGTDKANYAYNNFWSKGDTKPGDTGTASGLGFGTYTQHINVEDQVCKSTATDPDELVYRGSLLNIGAKPDSDPSGLEVANKTYADRFGALRRSESGGDWTYGAFQQANITEIDTIVWVGGNSGLWDVRSNWVTTSGRKINCANFFSPQLHVIIPDAENLKNVPIIPSWDDTATRGEYPEEYVAAGLRASFDEVSQFTKSITIEAGGAIKGIENLNGDGTLRYTRAKNSMEVRRNEWVLVGGVIKKFVSGESGDVRDIKSRDFYIEGQTPHVYMQHFTVDGSTFKPGIPFTSLDETVATNSAFGIMIPDQYGPLKVPASRYYTRYENNPAKVGDGTQPKTFEFTGRFANEGAMPQYSATTSWTFVNNSYPANLNVAKLRYDNSGLQAKVYDYNDKSWTDVESSNTESGAVYVKPNNGFAIKASSAKTVTTTQDEYGSGSTTYYKRAFDDTYLRLRVQNTSDATASTLTIRYNGEMIDKAFSYNESTPEIYVADGENIYSSYGIDDAAKVIPISLRNKQANKNLTVKFSLSAVEGFESVILEDRLNSKTYNLTEGETPVFSGIAPGDCIGRFYLNINYAYEDVTSVDEGESDGSGSESRGIEIYEANGKQVVISSSDNVMLEQVYITDMSGRTTVKKLSDAHYNVLTLDGLQGVYVIKAVGDSASRTEKVIVK